MKSLLQSRTFWLAVIQFIGAVLLSVNGYMGAGGILTLKSVIDIILRVYTSQNIGKEDIDIPNGAEA